jgi:hypothetical protein
MSEERNVEVMGSADSEVREERLAGIQATLSEILREMKQQHRLSVHRDFSYSRLIGAVSQLLVIGLLFWTMTGLVDLGEISGPGGTTIKILGAILLQLLALTFFVLDRQEKG